LSSEERQSLLDRIIEKYQDKASDISDVPFAKPLIEIRSEFVDDKLWQFLEDHQQKLANFPDMMRFKQISDLSNIVISSPPPAADLDLLARRRDTYQELWPRFKPIWSDYGDSEMKYKGRMYLNTYDGLREFSEKLQNWYYDLSGGMMMTDVTRETFFDLRREIQVILEEGRNSSHKMKKNDIDRVRQKTVLLYNEMYKDIGMK
jgi:hypothetical protein